VNNNLNNQVYTNVAPYCEENIVNNNFNNVNNAQTVAGTTCTISEANLRAQPFYLPELASVSCQIIAINAQCDSVASVGAGAVMPVLATPPDAPTIQFVARSCGSITVQCNPGNFDGGAAIDAYIVNYYQSNFNNQAANSVQLVQSNDDNAFNRRQLTVNNLNNGQAYQFSCASRNRIGYGQASANLEINVGIAPIQPYNVMTSTLGDYSNVAVTWNYQDLNCPGWAVNQCTVAIQLERNQVVNGVNQVVTSFTDATQYCVETPDIAPGAQNNLQRYVAPGVCSIPSSVLTANPFGFSCGESIYARVVCQNIIGASVPSTVENGASLPCVPHQVSQFTCTDRTINSISLSWAEPSHDGGAPLTCYQITYTQIGSFNNQPQT